MYIKGVNLGNWLVLEKWMSPALFDGTTAEDEYYLPRQLSPEVYEARIKVHRSEYISERDFATIRRIGLNTVRIPVPYFIFGDRPPFIGCIEELDKAFNWAEKYGIKILVDLHTAPLSQNGFDNGGICGVCKWSQTPEEVDFVLDVLEKLAKRYGRREGLFGITPINEPITEPMWTTMNVPNRYPPVEPELAAGSAPNTMEFLRGFYTRAFDRIQPNLKDGAFVVFHDAFRLKDWKDFLTQEKFTGRVYLDTHQYLMVAEAYGCEQTLNGYIKYIQENYARDIAEVQEYVPIVCGEWCLFNSLAVGVDTRGGQTALNGMDFTESEGLSPEKKKYLYEQLANAQLAAWENGSGYFYWNYKLLLDPCNEPNWRGWDCWDLGKSVDLGWFPANV
ncbi:MAG: cellulase family glycosylhydrolase [Oscillospiraceae bacterium]|nr:cellulase family glycosylhydrolase [Oscillospiraceae bacterium]